MWRPACSQEGHLLARAERGPKARVWRKEGSLTKVWVTSILFQWISVDKTVQLILCGTKNENLESLGLALSLVNKRGWGGSCGSYLRHVEKGGPLQ